MYWRFYDVQLIGMFHICFRTLAGSPLCREKDLNIYVIYYLFN